MAMEKLDKHTQWKTINETKKATLEGISAFLKPILA